MGKVNELTTTDPNSSGVKSSNVSKIGSQGENMVKFDSGLSATEQNIRFTKWRWIALIFIGVSGGGGYYGYDLTYAVRDEVIKHIMNGSNDKILFNQLYTIGLYISVVLSVFSGYALDKIGLNKGFIIFSIIMIIGQVIFTLSVFIENKHSNAPLLVALLGRLIFGFGQESIGIGQHVALSDWFLTQEMSFAFGSSITVARIGTVLNYWLTPIFTDWAGLRLSFSIGIFLGTIGAIFAYFFTVINKKLFDQREINYLYRNNYSEKFSWSDIKNLNRRFWVLGLILGFIYIGIFGFATLDKFYEREYNLTDENSKLVKIVTFMIPGVLAPIFGFVLDIIGQKIVIAIFSSLMITIAHIFFMAFTTPKDGSESYWWILPVGLLGIGYSLFVVALWSLIPLIVKPNAIGTAFGISSSFQNLGVGFGTLISSIITNNNPEDSKYFWNNLMFAIGGIISTILGIVLYIFDYMFTKKANKKSKKLLTYKYDVDQYILTE